MIIADSGTMVVTPDKQSLLFTLKNGSRYQEKGERNVNSGTELIRMSFHTYKKVMELSSFKMNKRTTAPSRQFPDADDRPTGQGHRFDETGQQPLPRNDGAGSRRQLHLRPLSRYHGLGQGHKKPTPSRYLLPVDSVRTALRSEWQIALKKQDSIDKAQDSIRKTAAHPQRVSGAHSATPPSNLTPPPGQAPGQTPANTAARIPGTPNNVILTDLLPDTIRNRVLDKAMSILNSSRSTLYQPIALYDQQNHQLIMHEEPGTKR